MEGFSGEEETRLKLLSGREFKEAWMCNWGGPRTCETMTVESGGGGKVARRWLRALGG